MASHVQEATDASYLSSAPTLTYSPMGSEFAGGISQEKSTQPVEIPPIIPPTHPYRTLVLCFDGTGDQFDSDNSNIVELFQMLRKDDQDKQMVYYQAGIGTYVWPQVATPLATRISKSLDEAIAWNLDAHLMDGYSFLMQNYKAGDKICIFGFSRGAYTARSLAGMIHKVGLLPACNHQQVPFAYKMYTKTTEQGWAQSNAFKKAFSVDVPIEFVGVWDTVNSVGLIPKTLPFSTSNTIVKTFRHAVSLDERRAKFKANLWNRPNKEEQELGVEGQKPIYHHNSVDEAMLKAQQEHEAHEGHDHRPAPKKNGSSGILDKIGVDNKPKVTQKQMETKYSGKADKETDVEEVWFSGCHCDVGGGSVSNDTPHSLARIPLRWMIRECFKTNSGIMFSSEGIRKSGIDPANLYPIVRKRPEALPTTGLKVQKTPSTGFFSKKPEPVEPSSACLTEEEHELHDALSPKYDQLSIAKTWWILEIWPVKQRYQKGNKEWVRYWKCNMGQGRFIPKQASRMIKVHRSVRMRMETEKEGSKSGKKYRPMADFKRALSVDHIEWVD